MINLGSVFFVFKTSLASEKENHWSKIIWMNLHGKKKDLTKFPDLSSEILGPNHDTLKCNRWTTSDGKVYSKVMNKILQNNVNSETSIGLFYEE